MACCAIPEAPHYLGLPVATMRAWALGQKQGDKAPFKPIIVLPTGAPVLSFMNLVEAQVLAALRRQHRVSLQKIRTAVTYLQRRFPSRHPLAENAFATDGVELFIEKFGEIINLAEPDQLLMKMVLEAHLSRIERDARGAPLKLFPFSRRREASDPKSIAIDPRVSFGRPVLAGTGIPTMIVAERYKAGESIAEIAEDYHRQPSEIEEAVRCERAAA
jgi:uncharacterized protein (DUF433 family)